MSEQIKTPTIKFSDIKRMVESLSKSSEEDFDISFEFLIVALFPNCWYKIKDEMNRQYTAGYIAGRQSLSEQQDDIDCYCE